MLVVPWHKVIPFHKNLVLTYSNSSLKIGTQSRELLHDSTLKLMSTGSGSSSFASLGKARQYYRARLIIAMHRALARSFLFRIADILFRRQHINLSQDDSDSIDSSNNNSSNR